MSTLARLLLPLGLVLALLTGTAWWVVERTGQSWFVRDVELRADLAARSAGGELLRAVEAGNRSRIVSVLDEMTLDVRLMAAVVCDATYDELARTDLLPPSFSCEQLAAWDPHETATIERRSRIEEVAGGPLHIAQIPLVGADGKAAAVVGIVHDMSFATRRAGATRWFVLGALVVLALATAAATIIMTRVAWRSWTREVRRVLQGQPAAREFRPLLADLRELASRLAIDAAEPNGPRWSVDRLRQVVRDGFAGDRIVIVANREPYIHRKDASGEITVVHPASGLVTALEPVMRACAGVWVGHGAGNADRETADGKGRLPVPPDDPSYTLRRVWLSPEDERGYYYGFSNEGLWPLCHVAHVRPTFRADDWQAYRKVNQQFVDAVREESPEPDPVVLIQDYHFAMAPAQLRQAAPRATILTFWHIPWPSAERFGICPWRRELLQGLLGSSIIGFHTQGHCNNFLEAVDRYLEARIDRESQAVIYGGHRTLVRAYPISVEWPSRFAAAAPPVDECRRKVLADLGLPPDTLLGVGVDRLDYTKGIEERLLAVECLLTRHPEWVGRFCFVQLAAPSRTEIDSYRALNDAVEALAARINQRFGGRAVPPVILLREHHDSQKVFTFYRAADLCYVSSLHDGMNLVAKEFVAARDDEHGVLILSSFAGAARELTEALVVNPYDIEQASDALHRALTMPGREQIARLRAMRELIAEYNVYRWAGHMLGDAARLRQQLSLGADAEAA